MPRYVYEAIMKDGRHVRNKVEDASRHSLIMKLKRNNMMPISVREIKGSTSKAKKNRRNTQELNAMLGNLNTGNIVELRKLKTKSTFDKWNDALKSTERITNRDVVIFTQNFYLLKKANFNNIHALSTILESTENISFRDVIEDILAGVEAGENIYTTMEYYPDIFPYIYVNMVKVGELSGSLTTSLQQAVTYLEDVENMNKKLKKILIPNIVQFVGILILLIAGTLFAIPAIQNVFDEVGTKDTLPPLTIWFSNFINDFMLYWYVPVLVIVAIVVMILVYIRTPKGKYNFDKFKYKMPIFPGL